MDKFISTGGTSKAAGGGAAPAKRAKTAARGGGAAELIRGAARGHLEAFLIAACAADPSLEARAIAALTAARPQPPPRTAADATLTVGGTGAFDKLGERSLMDLLLYIVPWERLGALSACKGWVALRRRPELWPSLTFRAANPKVYNRSQGPVIGLVSERTLAKFFGGSTPVFPPLPHLERLELADSASNSNWIKCPAWTKLLKSVRATELRSLAVSGRVFSKITFYKAAAAAFGAGLWSFELGKDNGGVNVECLRAILSKCPCLTRLTMPAVANGPQIVAEELRKARGGQPLLDALTFTGAGYRDGALASIDQLLSEVQRYFPEIRELEFAIVRLADVAPSSSLPSPLSRLASLKVLATNQDYTNPDPSATRGAYFSSAIALACPALESLDVYFGQYCESDRLSAFLDPLDALANLRTLVIQGLHISAISYGTLTLAEQGKAETYVDPNLVAATIVTRAPSSLASLSLEFCPGPECDRSWEARTETRTDGRLARMGLVKSIISAVARHPSRALRRPMLRIIRVRTRKIMSHDHPIRLPSMWLDA